MGYEIPTLDELHDFVTAHLKALFPDLDVSRTSFPALWGRTVAAAVTDNHAHILGARADLLPQSAEGPALDAWGTVAGVPRKSATVSYKAGALRVVNGDAATSRTVTAGDELVHSSGLRFAVNETVSVSASSSADVDVISIDTGSATRLAAGEILTFVSPLVGIEEDAELQLAIDNGGEDSEADGALRARILARFATPPLGGAANDYVAWATAVSGIAAAYCYPMRQGLGTVDVAALHSGSGAARLLGAGERAALLAAIEEKRPVGVTVRVLEVVAQPVDVEILIQDTGEVAYSWDWVDSTPLEIDSWTSATRTILFTTALPATMAAGHRIVLATAGGDGAQYVIEALSGPDTIVLEQAPAVTPDGLVYSGGNIVDAVRQAVQQHIDSLGTANLDVGSYGPWDGTLRVATLYRAIAGVAGVRDATVVAPASNVAALDPPYPGDDAINLITAGRILVRRQW